MLLEKVKKYTCGAIKVFEEEGFVKFRRFTDKQMEIIASRNFTPRQYSNSCIRIEFMTRGGKLSFDYEAERGSGRKYFSIDLSLDGWLVKSDYYDDSLDTPLTFEYEIPSSEAPVHATVYLPNMACVKMKSLTLPEDAETCEKKYKILILGDSITHGYDAVHTSLSYANIVADHFSAEMVNQGIGGEVFHAPNLDPELGYEPDFIITAYGTNDWGHGKFTDGKNVDEYFTRLEELYPGVPVFALLPIWRGEKDQKRNGINLAEAVEIIKKNIALHSEVTMIDCYKFVPPLPEFFYDKILHPNDEGFLLYGEAVCKALDAELAKKKLLK